MGGGVGLRAGGRGWDKDRTNLHLISTILQNCKISVSFSLQSLGNSPQVDLTILPAAFHSQGYKCAVCIVFETGLAVLNNSGNPSPEPTETQALSRPSPSQGMCLGKCSSAVAIWKHLAAHGDAEASAFL